MARACLLARNKKFSQLERVAPRDARGSRKEIKGFAAKYKLEEKEYSRGKETGHDGEKGGKIRETNQKIDRVLRKKMGESYYWREYIARMTARVIPKNDKNHEKQQNFGLRSTRVELDPQKGEFDL